MKRASRPATPFVLATVLFLASAGFLVAMEKSPPPKPTPQRTTERLPEPREIQGVPCRDRAAFTPDGRLASCVLSREYAFGTIVLPARTEVSLRADGTPSNVFLGEDATLDGHRCRGTYPRGWTCGFHPNGRLRNCYLAKPETIDGVPCRAGSFWGEMTGGVVVTFHDNGRLQTCRLAHDVTIAGRTFKDGTRIKLDATGTPVNASR